MSEHTVTENIIQSGDSRTGQLVCSCGVETDKVNLRKTSLRVLRAQINHMHKQVNPETRKVVESPKEGKKSKKQKTPTKLTLEDDGKAREALESDDGDVDFTVTGDAVLGPEHNEDSDNEGEDKS